MPRPANVSCVTSDQLGKFFHRCLANDEIRSACASGYLPNGLQGRRVLRGIVLVLLAVASASCTIPVFGEAPKPIRALLVLGGCCHDYETQKELLSQGLSARAHVEVIIAYDADTTTRHLNPIYESADWAKDIDVVIHDECSADVKDLAVIDRILEPHRRGLPAVILHCGMHCYRSEGYPQKVTPWFEFTGLQSTGHGPQAPIALTYIAADNPITQGLKGWTTINEELYNNSTGQLLDTARPLAKGQQVVRRKSKQQPEEATKVEQAESIIVWTNNYRDTARVFATTLGHNNETVADARYLDLVTRGLLWSCDKLNDEYLKPAKPQAD